MSAGLFFDPAMRSVSAVGKCLFVYLLMDSPTALSRRSIRQMRLDVDHRLEDGDIARALDELVAAGVVRWDADNEVVWVVNGLRHQAPVANPNLGIHARNHLDTLPRSPLLDEFKERYADWLVAAGAIDRPAAGTQLRLIDGGLDPERRIASAFEAAMPGANTSENMREALAIYCEGQATVEEIEKVVDWWRTHGRGQKLWLRDCFLRFGPRAAWSRMCVQVLGREPQPPKRQAHTTVGIDDSREAFRRHMEKA